MNPPQFDMAEDMAELTQLNEPCVVHNLTVRFRANQIYTYSGLFLVAVNPYRQLPIYSDECMQSYKGRRRGELSPHIYAVADQAYHDMLHDKENQSILITGESGAGKTENTKVAIQYLTTMASKRILNKNGTVLVNQLEQQILQANPILESFGNAQTIRNNNSSRFGKFIRIEFNMQAHICGANIEWYLLEKSRVHSQSSKERNYHIFYQLLNADKAMKEELLLNDDHASQYGFLKDSQPTIEDVDDAKEYENLINAMHIMGLKKDEIRDFLRMVAAVLHLGNIALTADYSGERADVRDFSALERTCHLLGIPAQEFKKSLLTPRIKAGRDWVNQAKSPAQVMASVDALAKTIYERNFGGLVDRINRAIDCQKTTSKMGFIGVLDIAGFEIFEVNSFEQLCINYTNEKLQQFFNHNMFVLEQEEYKKERIEWSFIDFGLDLQPTIDLIEKTNPVGILSCLEEECVAPRGTDKRFLEKLNSTWVSDDPEGKYKSIRFKESFTVKHYAGQVEYSTAGWINKNKDPLNEDITRLLARSTNRHVATLFEDYLTETEHQIPNESGLPTSSSTFSLMKLRKGGGSFRTVGQRHKQQLLSLMNTLYLTHPHFVRCILPNGRKHAGEIQALLVLDQLRCNGVLEGIRICRKGFPNRLVFADFRKRYEILCPRQASTNCFVDGRSACQTLLDSLALDSEKYRIGNTKVFFKATVLAELEEIRDRKLSEYITRFQAGCRRYIARYHLTRVSRQAEAIKIMQRNARIYVTLREWSWWKIYAKLKPLNVAYRVESQIKEKDQRIADLENSIAVHQQSYEDLQDQHSALVANYKTYKELLANEQRLTAELEETKIGLSEKLRDSKGKIDQMLAEIKQIKDQVDERQQKIDELETKASSESELLAETQKVAEDHSLERDILAAEYEALEEKHRLLESQLEAVETKSQNALMEVNQSFDSQIQERDTKIKQLKSDLEARQRNESLLQQTIETNKNQYQELISQKESVCTEQHQELVETQFRLSASKENLARCEAELEEQSKSRRVAENRLTEVESKLSQNIQSMAAEAEKRKEIQEKYDSLQVDLALILKAIREEVAFSRERTERLEDIASQFGER
ncbi:P-loop containing nucleoside triphosphate hydrolase protein [Phycomyces blakesleeanus]